MNTRLKLTGALALMSALLIGCSASSTSSSGSGSGANAGGTATDVTLSGVVSTGTGTASTAGGISKTAGGVTTAALTGYKLYCVTFTDSPISGSGDLTGPDANGDYNYNVTLTNAAGLPIGCFINDASNNPVSTVTFNITGSSDLSSSSTGAALGGGSHTVNISFDPDTGASTATVTSSDIDTTNNANTTTAADLLTLMAGAWNMACTDPDPGYANGQELTPTQYDALPACQRMLMTNYVRYDNTLMTDIYSWNGSGGMPLYLNFVSGTQDGNPVYAMGVWPSQTQFTNCGSTEGMSQTALTGHGVTVTGQTTGTGNPVGNFTGVQTALANVSGGGGYDVVYDSVNNKVNVTGNLLTIETALNTGSPAVYPYDPTFDNSNGGWCDDTLTAGLTSFDLNTDEGRQERACFADFMGWSMQDRARQGDATAACAPVLDSNTLYQTIWAWDQTLNGGAGGFTNTNASSITVNYRTSLGGVSPQIGGRYALMGLQLVSGAGLANDHHEDHWSYWDASANSGAGANYDCKFVEDMSINIIPAADGQTATGHFTVKDWQGCADSTGTPVNAPGTGDSYNTFNVTFAR